MEQTLNKSQPPKESSEGLEQKGKQKILFMKRDTGIERDGL